MCASEDFAEQRKGGPKYSGLFFFFICLFYFISCAHLAKSKAF